MYFDLLAERERRKTDRIAIVRLEQFYPYPEWHVADVLGSYTKAGEVCWVQEEPQNMGAWNFLRHRIPQSLPVGRLVRYTGRPESFSPAPGLLRAHRIEQAALVREAFD